MAVQGNIKDMGLPNLIQNLCIDRRRVSLLLRRQLDEGIIYFEGGEIVHATLGDLEGEEAVYKLLAWNDGTFRISNDVTAPRKTVTVPWGHLLMEGLKQVDEQREAQNQARELSPEQVEHDDNLQIEIILLLSNLEQMLARLREKKVRQRPAIALKILMEVVNEIVEFSETWSDSSIQRDSLNRALAKAGDVHPAARLLQVRNNRLSVGVVLSLHSSWSGDATGRQQMFEQIGRSLLDVIQTYFSILVSSFHSSSVAEESLDACNVFWDDLMQAVEDIRF